MRPAAGSQKRSSRLAIVVLPAPDGPTIATVAPAGIVERDTVERRPAGAGIGEADIVEADRRAADRRRRPHRAVDDRRLLALHGVIAPGRGDRVGELAADLRDLGDRQERGERQQDQQRQGRRRELMLGGEHPAPTTATASPPSPVAISSCAVCDDRSRSSSSRIC